MTLFVAATALGVWCILPAQPAIGVSVEMASAGDDPPADSPGQWRVVRLLVADAPLPLGAFLALLPYDWDAVMAAQAPVPRVYINAIPASLSDLNPPEARKRLFLRAVLPLVLRENERLRRMRWRLLELRNQARVRPLSGEQWDWVERVARHYGVATEDFRELLRRVDEIPTSLAVAQAAEESGWGTSRFVCHGNALFGQWSWGDTPEDMRPQARDDGLRHRVQRFTTLGDAVRAYAFTLNTHWAYEDFRAQRAYYRSTGRPFDGRALAEGLSAYSTRRDDYVDGLIALIRANRLEPLDHAQLAPFGITEDVLIRYRKSGISALSEWWASARSIAAQTIANDLPLREGCS